MAQDRTATKHANSLALLQRPIIANTRNYSSMEIDQVRLLKALEAEKARLKRAVVDLPILPSPA